MSSQLALDRRAGAPAFVEGLFTATARRYRAAGRTHHGFVRGKLRYDPMYGDLLLGDVLPRSGRLVDVGCGRGLFLALIDTARRSDWVQGGAPAGWRPPSADLALHGIELRPSVGRAARAALGAAATIEIGNVGSHPLPPASAIALLDVLHYLDPDGQEALVARAARALVPGGVLLIREADARPSWRFAITRLAERLRAWGRGHWRPRFGYRSTAAWQALLERQGLSVHAQPMSRGTPFDNQLIVAQRAPAAGAPIRRRQRAADPAPCGSLSAAAIPGAQRFGPAGR